MAPDDVRAINLDWWQIIAVLGALQGIVIAFALAAKRTNRTAHRLLAALLVAFAGYLVSVPYYATGLVERWPHFFGVSHPLQFTFGPLTWLYALSAGDRSRRLGRRDAWHALLPGLVLGSVVPIYALSGAEKVALFDAIQAGDVPWQVALSLPLLLVSGIVYAAMTLRLVARHQRLVEENYSSLEQVNLLWLRWLSLASAGIWLTAFGFEALDRAGVRLPVRGDDALALLVTGLIYAIGYRGLRQPEIFQFATAEYPVPVASGAAVTPGAATLDAVTDDAVTDDRDPAIQARYERSGLTPRQAAALRDRLVDLMGREHVYRDADLTLGDLAERLATTPHKLSEVLNAQLRLTFYDFVNGYRVREVQRRLAGDDGARLTYLALALDAGFSSKSTFNAVFKKHTGRTPSEYRAAPNRADGPGAPELRS